MTKSYSIDLSSFLLYFLLAIEKKKIYDNIYLDIRCIVIGGIDMAVSKELLKGTTTLLILQLLSEGDKYGYEMTRELEKRSDELFNLKEGTLYPILHNLENEDMIEAYWENTESARKRKYYRITKKGNKLLGEKKEEWMTYSKGVLKVLGGGACLEPIG